MSYIECPSCGKTALSVASRCPHCSLIFTADIVVQAAPPEEPRRLGRLLVMAGALVALAAVVVVLQNWMGGESAAGNAPAVATGLESQPTPSAPPPDSAREAEVPPVTASTAAPTQSQPLDTARSIRAEQPAPSRDTVVDSTPAPVAPPPQPPPPRAGPQLQRYAKTWVNVRGGRSRNAPEVRVLNPGEAVMVDSLVRGWYRVHVDGQPVGYVDQRYLDVEGP
jgi:hypothetical protein